MWSGVILINMNASLISVEQIIDNYLTCLLNPRRRGDILITVNDDWRVQVDFAAAAHANALSVHLATDRLKHDLSRVFADRVIVSVDGHRMFLYAGTREQAEKAREVVEAEARTREWKLVTDFRRWHPAAEEWEDPEVSLPNDEAAKRSERERLMKREREETAIRGYPEFEVRAELNSRHDAVALTERLRDEGLSPVRRWRYLLVGATDEDSATELAAHIRTEIPSGGQVKVEGTVAAARADSGLNSFAVFDPHSGATRRNGSIA